MNAGCIARMTALSLLLLAVASVAESSTPQAWVEDSTAPLPGWKTYSNEAAGNGNGSRIHVRGDGETRPMLLMIPGSTCTPIFMETMVGDKKGVMLSTPVFSEAEQKKLGVHMALLERRGMKAHDKAPAGCSASHGGVTLEHRASDVLEQARFLAAYPRAEGLLLVGMSEGAVVAAAAAAELGDSVKGVLSMGGAGMPQLFDLLELSRKQGDDATRSYLGDLRGLLDESLSGEYMGYPVERWRSFGVKNAPYEDWIESDAPLMIVHGVDDASVPISSVDAGVIELLRAKPNRHVYYWSIPGVGHDFASGQSGLQLMNPLFAEFIDWIRAGAPARLRHETP